MPLHQETRVLPYTADQMYAVVADVQHYPEFLPWCEKLVVKKREKQDGIEFVTAEMFIAYPPLRERYVSRVRLDPERRAIEARHVQGPFQKLDTRWRFVPLSQGSEVHFLIDFAFKSLMLSAVANVAFGFVASRMADAFVHRAEKLYRSENLQA
jgi:coenzyme Q-binding protein COQ10